MGPDTRALMYSVSCIHYRDGAEEARGTHNPEVVGSNPTSGIYHLSAFQKPMVIALATLNKSNTNRGSAGAARGAHNLEVVRSKRTPGIYHSGGFIRTRHRCLHSTTNRLSSSEERTAHNREVTGSTPVGGITHSQLYQKLHPLS